MPRRNRLRAAKRKPSLNDSGMTPRFASNAPITTATTRGETTTGVRVLTSDSITKATIATIEVRQSPGMCCFRIMR